MKLMVGVLALWLIVTPLLAETVAATSPASREAGPRANFLTEFDITFWQTLPFITMWSSFAASQLAAGGAVSWNNVLYFSAAASAVNAFVHAKKTAAARSW
jgi:hypothetical protein